MMRFYSTLLVILFAMIFSLQIRPVNAASIGYDVNYAKSLGGKMPGKGEASAVLDQPVDTRKLERHNDASLLNSGQSELSSSELGQLVRNSKQRQDNAKSEYKINSNNQELNDSIKISSDPQGQFGKLPTSREITSDTVLEKTCTEGVEFDTTIGHNLIYDCEEEEYDGPPIPEARSFTLSHNEIRGLFGEYKQKLFWGLGSVIHLHGIDPVIKKRIIASHLNIPAEQIGDAMTFYRIVKGKKKFSWRKMKYKRGPQYKEEAYMIGSGDDIINYEIHYTYLKPQKLKRLKENGEYWQISTGTSENMVDNSQCYETSRKCVKRGVSKFHGKYDIERPCWQEEVNYHCQSEPVGGCQHLERQGCRLKSSICLEWVGGLCLKYKRVYNCRGGKRRVMQHGSLAGGGFCMGGECHQPVIEPNNNFSNVAYLAALNEANKDCVKQSNGMCRNPITIFPGERIDCKYIISGCINCCTKMKGWGKKIGLSKCSGEEKGLALKRDRGLCHKVGKYCSEKILGKCTIKKTSYCCFNSKLARVFHEQGRYQLGISWGSAEHPNCGPLRLDQLARIDFSKFDMDELFDALLNKGHKNANKKMPIPKEGQVPGAQAEQYKSGRGQRQGGL